MGIAPESMGLADKRGARPQDPDLPAQPFFVAELYTAALAEFVPLVETICVVDQVMQGGYDIVPAEAFRFSGGVDGGLEKAAPMAI